MFFLKREDLDVKKISTEFYSGCKESSHCVITASGRREDVVCPILLFLMNKHLFFRVFFSPVKKIFMTFLLMDKDHLTGIDSRRVIG